MRWQSRKTKPVVGVAKVVVLALMLASCNSPPELEVSSTTFQTAPTTIVEDSVHPNVPPIECGPLITTHDVDVAFDKVGELPQMLVYESGETCTHVLQEDEDLFIRIEPGDPADFEPGAILEGHTGQPTDGVGDEALWFGADGQPVSVISVRAPSSFGALHYRVVLSRSDADAATHREATRTLALTALARFPGVEIEPTEPVVYEFDTQPADVSGLGYVENLLANENNGEWTKGDGLVATLRYLTGEIGASGVLRHGQVDIPSVTPFVALAQEYAESGPDPEARAEVQRLLDLLVLPMQGREGMVEEPLAASGLLVSLSDVVAQETSKCLKIFGIPPPCLVEQVPPLLEADWPGQYKVFRPVASVAGDYDLDRIDATIAALTDAVLKFSKLVEMPSISIYLLTGRQDNATVVQYDQESACFIDVNRAPPLAILAEYQQLLARDIAYCLLFKDIGSIDPFWSDGFATYLSGYVYDETNLELEKLPMWLSAIELQTPMQGRTFTNWVFFEHLHPSLGAAGNLALVQSLATSGVDQLVSHWHSFNEELTDASVPDQGGGDVPYNPLFEDVQVTGPIVLPPQPDPIGVARAQITIPSGQKACTTFQGTGDVRSSWRSGVPGTTGGSWSPNLPEEMTDVITFLVTTGSGPGQLIISVEKLIPDDEDCDEDVIDLDNPSDDDSECDLCGPSGYYFKVFED
ncbi:MAG: hypothetical protein WBM90_12030 [Acidimicrobiia bacterium]